MLKDSHAIAGPDALAQVPPKRHGASKTAPARAVIDRPPQAQGWNTTDEDEIALRRWRGRTEITALEVLEPKQPIFGTYRIRVVPEARFAATRGRKYEVEIRSLASVPTLSFASPCEVRQRFLGAAVLCDEGA